MLTTRRRQSLPGGLGTPGKSGGEWRDSLPTTFSLYNHRSSCPSFTRGFGLTRRGVRARLRPWGRPCLSRTPRRYNSPSPQRVPSPHPTFPQGRLARWQAQRHSSPEGMLRGRNGLSPEGMLSGGLGAPGKSGSEWRHSLPASRLLFLLLRISNFEPKLARKFQ